MLKLPVTFPSKVAEHILYERYETCDLDLHIALPVSPLCADEHFHDIGTIFSHEATAGLCVRMLPLVAREWETNRLSSGNQKCTP